MIHKIPRDNHHKLKKNKMNWRAIMMMMMIMMMMREKLYMLTREFQLEEFYVKIKIVMHKLMVQVEGSMNGGKSYKSNLIQVKDQV
jgi:hypothetical protein